MDPRALEGKSVVVVGGTSGLGFSAAQACAAAGASVTAVGRSEAKVLAARKTLGKKGLVLQGDASDSATASRAIDAARSRFGRFDGLYHVAGGSGRKWGDGPLDEATDLGWQQTLDLNLTSVFYSNRAAVRAFREQGGGGVILNLSSVLAFSPSPRHFATVAYATAKAAIIGMTRSAAAYYAAENIRFNALAPALVETPMATRALADDTILDFVRQKQPLDGGRAGVPGDLDDAAVFLLSDGAKLMTGQVVTIDGGWSVTEGH